MRLFADSRHCDGGRMLSPQKILPSPTPALWARSLPPEWAEDPGLSEQAQGHQIPEVR